MNQRIIYRTVNNGVSIIIPTESVELALKDVPKGVPYEIVDADAIPSDRTFRGAWVMGDCCIDHDIDRCKTIGHEMRRAARAVEFAPHDEVIAKQIPGIDAAEAEAQRQRIRDKYAVIQEQIDAAESTNDIKTALGIS
jgi:hypothetical protein